MAKTGALRHTHRYYKSGRTWRCLLGGCTHFMPSNAAPDGPSGMNSVCWECSKEFMLTPLLMTIDKPVCNECREIVDRRPSEEETEGMIELNKRLRAKGYATIFDAPKEQVRTWMLGGKITQRIVDKLIEMSTPEEDEIEVIEPEDN